MEEQLMQRRDLILFAGLTALARALSAFRGTAPPPAGVLVNEDPVEVRVCYYGNLFCDAPRFYEDKPIYGYIADVDHFTKTVTVTTEAPPPDEPPRWDRVRQRWAAKGRAT